MLLLENLVINFTMSFCIDLSKFVQDRDHVCLGIYTVIGKFKKGRWNGKRDLSKVCFLRKELCKKNFKLFASRNWKVASTNYLKLIEAEDSQ